MLVWNYEDAEVEPWTIIYHPKTDTWWVVSHDKVERYTSENNKFVYVHNLELLGAIELLNARDLTDCGFNDNRYSVGEFIYRLFMNCSWFFHLFLTAFLCFLINSLFFI